MNREDQRHIPDDLRDRLAEEPADEQIVLEQVWHMVGAAELIDDDAPSADDTWAAVRARTEPAANGASRPPRHRMLWAVAAGLLLLVAAGALLWRQPATVVAPAGAHAVATLPDGSTVELNSGTTLSYPRHFSAWPFMPTRRRVVRLRGEAFFDVQPTNRPFVVETFNARIEVLGTRFNVRARAGRDTGETHVILAEGQVRVQTATQPDAAVTLTEAGQASRVPATSTPTPPQSVGIDRALAWRQQGFAVSDWPLPAIFDELERRYDLRITTRAGAAALADSMTLYYPRHTDAETIIHDIAVAKGLAYRATHRGFEITAQ
jgi:ferric-dicitrate binding protein FerR (iron transport regulator)